MSVIDCRASNDKRALDFGRCRLFFLVAPLLFFMATKVCAFSAPAGSDLDLLLNYCKNPSYRTLRDEDKLLASLPQFNRSDVHTMLRHLVSVRLDKSNFDEIQMICDTLPLALAANEKMLRCQRDLKMLQSYYRVSDARPDALIEVVERSCEPRCKHFSRHLDEALGDPKHRGEKLKHLLGRYEAVPLSLLLAVRRLEGGKVKKDKKNNLYGQMPDGFRKMRHSSPAASVQSVVDTLACLNQTKCSDNKPAYHDLHLLRAKPHESGGCLKRVSGRIAADGMKCYNPINLRYRAELKNVMTTYQYGALDSLWRDYEIEVCRSKKMPSQENSKRRNTLQ